MDDCRISRCLSLNFKSVKNIKKTVAAIPWTYEYYIPVSCRCYFLFVAINIIAKPLQLQEFLVAGTGSCYLPK